MFSFATAEQAALGALLILATGCGDIIKAKDPTKKTQPYQPPYVHDESGRCPYYPAEWYGSCSGEGFDSTRIYHLDFTQSGCRLFILQNTADFEINKTLQHSFGGVEHKTQAAWLNDERTILQLTEQWQDQGRSLERIVEAHAVEGIAVDRVQLVGGAEVSSCTYKRKSP